MRSSKNRKGKVKIKKSLRVFRTHQSPMDFKCHQEFDSGKFLRFGYKRNPYRISLYRELQLSAILSYSRCHHVLKGVVSPRTESSWVSSGMRYPSIPEVFRHLDIISGRKFLFFLLVILGILTFGGFSLAVTTISDNSIVLEPSSEPENPVFGMIYIDNVGQFRFYNGERWIGLVFEDDEDCKAQWECNDWGDCINGYQTRSCENLKPTCSGEKPEERNSCESGVEAAKEEPIEEIPEEVIEEVPEEEVSEEEVTEEEVEEIPEEVIEEVPEEEPVEEIPEELLDASIMLEENVISRSEDLTVRVFLESFGRKFASARFIYTILDSEGNSVYSSFDETRIYTERVVTKRFEDLDLEDGKYTLDLDIEYAGILEEFDQSFEIKSSPLKKIREFFSRIFGG